MLPPAAAIFLPARQEQKTEFKLIRRKYYVYGKKSCK